MPKSPEDFLQPEGENSVETIVRLEKRLKEMDARDAVFTALVTKRQNEGDKAGAAEAIAMMDKFDKEYDAVKEKLANAKKLSPL